MVRAGGPKAVGSHSVPLSPTSRADASASGGSANGSDAGSGAPDLREW
jgi:hypothetical protein